jgi:hypothetical protein
MLESLCWLKQFAPCAAPADHNVSNNDTYSRAPRKIANHSIPIQDSDQTHSTAVSLLSSQPGLR